MSMKMRYDVRFFQTKEFRCKCCGQDGVAVALVFHLDQIRRAWGGPIRVNSGFRCEARNKEVGGAKTSRHLIGCAADIAPVDATMVSVFNQLIRAMTDDMDGWETIIYSWGAHVAVPRSETVDTWTGGKISLTFR